MLLVTSVKCLPLAKGAVILLKVTFGKDLFYRTVNFNNSSWGLKPFSSWSGNFRCSV